MGLITKGQLVTSKMGRDSGRMYVVIGFCEGGRVQVADGLVRTITRPKKKNVKHLVVHQIHLGSTTFDNGTIREFIKKHNLAGMLREEGPTEHG